MEFQSTLPAWGATGDTSPIEIKIKISIHAPRMGSDFFNTTSLSSSRIFQSTLPAWGATLALWVSSCTTDDFNPRSPHGERRLYSSDRSLSECDFNPRSPHGERRRARGSPHYQPEISIHAPRMGSDKHWYPSIGFCNKFQSTLPAWGATLPFLAGHIVVYISIHAPRMGSDRPQCANGGSDSNFNPRSPHGERPSASFAVFAPMIFQSTLPAWGATPK